MSQGKQFNIALSEWQISEIERQAKILGMKRTELVVKWITAHIREEQSKNPIPVLSTPKETKLELPEDDDEDFMDLLPAPKNIL
jgi:hemerythrin